MGKFNRDRGDRSDNRRGGSFGRRDSGRDFNRGGGSNFGRPSMHKAICDECGKDCEVPFKPSGDKPIYCSDCFEKKGSGRDKFGGGRDRGPRFESKGHDNSKEILKGIKTLNYKLDELIKALGKETPAEKTKEIKSTNKDIVDEIQDASKKTTKKAAAKKPAAKKTTKKAAAKKPAAKKKK